MGSPKIVWDSNTLTLEDLTDYYPSREVDKEVSRAHSGEAEHDIRERFDQVQIGLSNFDEQSLYDGIAAWWEWAAAGNTFAFALDGDDTTDTTLSASAAKGATSVTVTSATGISDGERFKIRDADGRNEEIVTVSGAPSGSTVTLSSGLLFARDSGAVFRSVDYFPSMESESASSPLRWDPGTTWTFNTTFREAKS